MHLAGRSYVHLLQLFEYARFTCSVDDMPYCHSLYLLKIQLGNSGHCIILGGLQTIAFLQSKQKIRQTTDK